MSEKDYKSVDLVVQISSSLEVFALYETYLARKWSYRQDHGGPHITIGERAGRKICIAPLIHIVEGVRVMYVEATSALIDWDMIDEWVKSVTGKDNIRIQNNPCNLPGDINSILWHRNKDIPTTPL